MKKQAKRREKQIEAEYAAILPILENFVDKLFDKMAEKVKTIKAAESVLVQPA